MNPVPFLWLAAVVGFLLLEASTFSMTSVWFAVGAAAALLTCLFTDSFRAQALVFIVVSILCLLAFRPLAAKLRQKITPTNGDQKPWPGGHRADHRHRRPTGPCATGRRGLECPLRHSRRHSHPGQRCRVTELHSTLLIVEPVLTESRRA